MNGKRIFAPLLLLLLAAALFICTGLSPTGKAHAAAAPRQAATDDRSAVDNSSCPGRIIVHYFTVTGSERANYPKTLCDLNSDGNCQKLDLAGYLYLPNNHDIADSPKRLPVVVFNHGSGVYDGDAVSCAMPKFFTERGYAFFIPFRRGHGLSTGTYYQDVQYLCGADCTAAQVHYGLVSYLKDQSFEVVKAVEYLLALRNAGGHRVIDPDKIALMGHSFGGIVTIFSNARMTVPKCAVAIAPASESWAVWDSDDEVPDSSDSLQLIKDAVTGGHNPLFLLEPLNDDSTRPTVVLAKVAGDTDPPHQYQAALFPAVPDPGDIKPHILFVTRNDEVQLWGPAAVEFMARYGVK